MLLLSVCFTWYSVTHMPAHGRFEKQNALTFMMTVSNQTYKDFKTISFKDAKLRFAGQEIPLNLNKDSLAEYIKSEPRAQRAVFVFGLFMLNVWLLPLIGGARQRRLKQELFDLHPHLVVDNMSESRQTPYYTSTFFDRILYMLYPGLFLIAFSFISAAMTVIFVGSLVGYAYFNYHLKTKKYESIESFQESMFYGNGLFSSMKQIISFLVPEIKKKDFDKAYREALSKAQKKDSDRKAG